MVKKIMRDPLFLAQKSVDATEDDKQVVMDLLDTLKANLDHCVGMAANMIGVKKNIIVVAAGPFQFAMINPVITGKSGAFQTEEGCLSLDGVRPCTRYKEIEVDYLDQNFKKKHGKYTGWTAQIIQRSSAFSLHPFPYGPAHNDTYHNQSPYIQVALHLVLSLLNQVLPRLQSFELLLKKQFLTALHLLQSVELLCL